MALTLLGTVPAWALDGGRYGEVRLIQPQSAMRGFVLFFSDRGGWTGVDQASVDALAAAGALVVGIDTDVYLSKIAPGDRACDQLVGDAEGISRQLQRQYGHIDYQFPILVGLGQGGTLAAVTLAQAPANTLSGAVSIDPAVTLVSHRPLCADQPPEPVGPDAFRYGPATVLNGFWTVGFSDAASQPDRDHVASLQRAGMHVTLLPLAGGTTPDAIVRDVQPHLYQGDPGGVEALPLVELPAESPSELMAVVISGDGGWRDLDRTIAEALQKDGVSVIGWDSVRYFWHLKTPEETAADLAAVLTKYGERWHAKKIALIGYSFGADVLPFLYNRLPMPLRAKIALVSLLGFTPKADWQISVSGWLGSPPSEDALPVDADLARMPPGLIQCFYGKEETDSFCPDLVSRGIDVIATEGGHHFDHDYAALEQRILMKLKQR
jgi:type IV secretory pathway VirJ component